MLPFVIEAVGYGTYGLMVLSKMSSIHGLLVGIALMIFCFHTSKRLKQLKREQREIAKSSSDLTTFNDAIVKELMRLRLDSVENKFNQEIQIFKELDKSMKPYWLAYPTKFAVLYKMYQSYPDDAVCAFYITPNGSYAGIIMLLDPIDYDLDHPYEFSEEELRKINTHKINKIAEGNTIRAHVFDPEDDDDRWMSKDLLVKVLSIKHKDDWSMCFLRLEIQIHDGNYEGHKGDPTTIIREIKIFGDEVNHFEV